MYNQVICLENLGNTGDAGCAEDFAIKRGFILVPKGFEIATRTLALTESTWTTAINAARTDRAYPFPLVFTLEPNIEDAVYAEGIGVKEFVRYGSKGYTFTLQKNSFGNHKELFTFKGSDWAVYYVTDNSFVQGISKDEVKFLPIPLSDFRVNLQSDATADDIARTTVTMTLQNPDDWDRFGAWVKPDNFDPRDFKGIIPVVLSAITNTTASIKFSVFTRYANEPIVGLVQTDFTYGIVGAITSFTDNGDGTYTLTPTTVFTAGASTITMDSQPDLSIAGYEAAEVLSFTIS
jgi:hypothetical protein